MFDSGSSLGKVLILLGLGAVVFGLLILILSRFGIDLGRLPGDIRVEGERGSFYFPIVTCLVLSVIASWLLHLFGGKR